MNCDKLLLNWDTWVGKEFYLEYESVLPSATLDYQMI